MMMNRAHSPATVRMLATAPPAAIYQYNEDFRGIPADKTAFPSAKTRERAQESRIVLLQFNEQTL
jgi:hypothetical protein